MNFFSLKFDTFGLDISDLSLKMIKLEKRGGKYRFSFWGGFGIEKGLIENGVIKNEEKLVKEIERGFEKIKAERIKTKYVICCLPEEKNLSQIIEMPNLPEENLAKALLFEIENYIPSPIAKVYFDFIKFPTPEQEKKCNVLISVYEREIVDGYLRVLKKIKLEPVVFEPEILSLGRLIPASSDFALIIDFGETRTNFGVFSGGILRFSTSTSFSSSFLTETIAKEFKIPFEDAEKLKKIFGLEESILLKYETKESIFKKERGKIFDALIPCLSDFLDQIKKILSYFEGLGPSCKIKHIFLTGGGALLKGLKEFVHLQTGIATEILNPLLTLPLIKEPKISFEEMVKYSCAIGLAKRDFYL
jgi:type IV pilus assembly protein PilM